ncbi:MAG: hypothetical protein PHC61_09025 [Chitinivibrionales bacterium]|nr:hypothetical protein [Chitinivibrionales bacterium]
MLNKTSIAVLAVCQLSGLLGLVGLHCPANVFAAVIDSIPRVYVAGGGDVLSIGGWLYNTPIALSKNWPAGSTEGPWPGLTSSPETAMMFPQSRQTGF